MRRKKKDCFTEIEEALLEKILTKLKRMEVLQMATRQELNAALEEIRTAVDADVAQDLVVVEKINALLEAIRNAGNTDFQEEVDALRAATTKLSSDNAAVQAALDSAVPPTNP